MSNLSLSRRFEHSDGGAHCHTCDTELDTIWAACNCDLAITKQKLRAGEIVKMAPSIVLDIIQKEKK